jgi:hypothetical protein
MKRTRWTRMNPLRTLTLRFCEQDWVFYSTCRIIRSVVIVVFHSVSALSSTFFTSIFLLIIHPSGGRSDVFAVTPSMENTATQDDFTRLYQQCITKETLASNDAIVALLAELGAASNFEQFPYMKPVDVSSLQFLYKAEAIVDITLDPQIVAQCDFTKERPLEDLVFSRHGVIVSLKSLFEMLAYLTVNREPRATLELFDLASGFLRTPPAEDSTMLYVSSTIQRRLDDMMTERHRLLDTIVLPNCMRTTLSDNGYAKGTLTTIDITNLDNQFSNATLHVALALDRASAEFRIDLWRTSNSSTSIGCVMDEHIAHWENTHIPYHLTPAKINKQPTGESYRWDAERKLRKLESTGALLQRANLRHLSRKPHKKHITALLMTRETPVEENFLPFGTLLVVQLNETEVEPLYIEYSMPPTTQPAHALVQIETMRQRELSRIIARLEQEKLVLRSPMPMIIQGFNPLMSAIALPEWKHSWAALMAGHSFIKSRHLEFLSENRNLTMTLQDYMKHMRVNPPSATAIDDTIEGIRKSLFGLIVLTLFTAFEIKNRPTVENPWQELVPTPYPDMDNNNNDIDKIVIDSD